MWILFDRSLDSGSEVGGCHVTCGFQDPAAPYTLNKILGSVEEIEDEMARAENESTLS